MIHYHKPAIYIVLKIWVFEPQSEKWAVPFSTDLEIILRKAFSLPQP